MNGLDSNVLIRYFVEDDPIQTPLAARVIEEAARRNERLFLSLLVLCETVWVLDRRYGFGRVALGNGIERVLESETFLVEREVLAHAALARFRTGKGGFADYVIGFVAQEAGCDATFTFDRDLRGGPGFQVLH